MGGGGTSGGGVAPEPFRAGVRTLLPGDVVDLGPGTGVCVRFVETTGSSGGRRLVTEWTVPRFRGAAPHVHPGMTESFHVLSGRMTVREGRAHRVLLPGESLVARPGTAHGFANTYDEPLRWRQVNEPAGNHERLFELLLETMAARGTADPSPRGPVAAALLFHHMDGYVAGVPRRLQTGLLGPLGSWADRRHRRRGAFTRDG
jgi:quercetin dioxygenase-like cupin family protein